MADEPVAGAGKPERPAATCPCCGTKIPTPEAASGLKRWRYVRIGLLAVAGICIALSAVLKHTRSRYLSSGLLLFSLGIMLATNLQILTQRKGLSEQAPSTRK